MKFIIDNALSPNENIPQRHKGMIEIIQSVILLCVDIIKLCWVIATTKVLTVRISGDNVLLVIVDDGIEQINER